MRYINKGQIHTEAVRYGRSRKGMTPTANRLAKCNVDNAINDLVLRVKKQAWEELDNNQIVEGLARVLWLDFMQAELLLHSK